MTLTLTLTPTLTLSVACPDAHNSLTLTLTATLTPSVSYLDAHDLRKVLDKVFEPLGCAIIGEGNREVLPGKV